MESRIATNTNLSAFSRGGAKRKMVDLIPLYARHGFRDLDINLCEMMNPSSELNGRERNAYIGRLLELKEEYGLSYFQSHAPYPRHYSSLSEKEKDESRREILDAMEIAHELGIDHIVIHPIDAPVDGNIRYFEDLIANGSDIRIAVENMEEGYAVSAEELIGIVDGAGGGMGICLDTGHANIAGCDIPSFIEKAGDRIIATHIADNDGKRDLHLLPGWGNIEWEKVIPAFRRHYSGFLTYEVMFFSRNAPECLTDDIIRLSYNTGLWLSSL